MNVLDLCVGAGGLSLGFERAGHRVIAGVDKWDDALDTYRHNHASIGLQRDLHSTDPEELPLSRNQVDLIAGGPPCKGFSLAGKRDESDDRNKLIARFLDYVDYFEPDEVVMENVPGIRSMELPGYDNSVPEYIHSCFRDMGYMSEDRTLTATDYGVAQSRDRVFFRASTDSIQWPVKVTPDDEIPVGTLLDQDFDQYPNHNYTNHQQSTIEELGELDYEESKYDAYTHSWRRLHPDKPSHTIMEHHGAPFVHPYQDRVGTPRECAAIQSFPNEYEFLGSKSSVLKQIGNAVPPALAMAIAETVKP